MRNSRTVWIPLPDCDFDPTEVAIPWWVLTRTGHRVVFATERGGSPPQGDHLMLTGILMGLLGAATDAVGAYREMERSEAFRNPIAWESVDTLSFDGLILPGGHAPGMKQY